MTKKSMDAMPWGWPGKNYSSREIWLFLSLLDSNDCEWNDFKKNLLEKSACILFFANIYYTFKYYHG